MKKMLAVFMVLAAVSACRTDQPPKLSLVCLGDGFGGADCVDSNGANKYLAPSELKDFWMTTETDEANFASWCYGEPVQTTSSVMAGIRSQIVRQ